MNQTHIIDSWIAELKMGCDGARGGPLTGIRSWPRRLSAIAGCTALAPCGAPHRPGRLTALLGADSGWQAVPQIAPCLGG